MRLEKKIGIGQEKEESKRNNMGKETRVRNLNIFIEWRVISRAEVYLVRVVVRARHWIRRT